MSGKKKVILVLVALILVLAGGLFFWLKTKPTPAPQAPEPEPEPVQEPVKEIEVFKGDDRPIGVMIDNHYNALPQAGLNDAYVVYEITVEGGESRLFALFKGKDLDKIGPIRSARHYFLDYALEHDAIFTHYGWSPQAQRDIPNLEIDNVHGMEIGYPDFVRAPDKYSPHDVVTTTEDILKNAKEEGYRTTSKAESVLHYVPDEVLLEGGKACTSVDIPYMATEVQYEYDAKTKRYTRYSKGSVQEDWRTDKEVTVKNIIITFADTVSLGDYKGRQDLKNIGTQKGYYITNGKYIEITSEKKTRGGKTVYKNAATGEVLDVNDGNTFIQIVPKDSEVILTEKKS